MTKNLSECIFVVAATGINQLLRANTIMLRYNVTEYGKYLFINK